LVSGQGREPALEVFLTGHGAAAHGIAGFGGVTLMHPGMAAI
jgi:hypothetical protein